MLTRNEKIEKNMGLVHACAKRFIGRGIEYDDIFQNGCIGLVKAVDSFDEDRGVKFSTYAVPVIFGEIKRLFRETGAIKVGRKLKDLSLKIRKESSNFLSLYGRSPTINELSDMLCTDKEQIVNALESSQIPMSLTSESDDDDEQMDIAVEFNDEKISTRLTVENIINSLEVNDKNIIYMRFFKGITQSKVAKALGMTQVQVSRREKFLLSTMRKKLV